MGNWPVISDIGSDSERRRCVQCSQSMIICSNVRKVMPSEFYYVAVGHLICDDVLHHLLCVSQPESSGSKMSIRRQHRRVQPAMAGVHIFNSWSSSLLTGSLCIYINQLLTPELTLLILSRLAFRYSQSQDEAVDQASHVRPGRCGFVNQETS